MGLPYFYNVYVTCGVDRALGKMTESSRRKGRKTKDEKNFHWSLLSGAQLTFSPFLEHIVSKNISALLAFHIQ